MTNPTYELLADGQHLIASFASFEAAREAQKDIAYRDAPGAEGAKTIELFTAYEDRRGFICRDYTREGAAELRRQREESREPAWDAWRSAGRIQDPESGEYIWM